MALSLNSVAGFNSTRRENFQNISRPYTGASGPKTNSIAASTGLGFRLRRKIKDNRSGLVISAADVNQVATESSDKDSRNAERALSKDHSSEMEPLSINSSPRTIQPETSTKDELGCQIPEASNGLRVPSEVNQNTVSTPNVQSKPKRSPLTAREKLRAARVLSRYTESKPSKSEMGSKVLDALRESDRGKKRSVFPEAPENLFDDSKRGMPKAGLTFDFPGGADLFFIVLSFALISTIMFGTTYVVWKVGAIHFNEY